MQNHFDLSTRLESAHPCELFLYAEESDNGRMWRPDLVPHIVQWLDALSPAETAKLDRLRVSDVGGFVAVFGEVYVEFDSADEMTLSAPVHGRRVVFGELVSLHEALCRSVAQ